MTATVLLPVYNGAKTLREAVESVLAQDEPAFELLIVDDASTDGSAALAEEYARRDPRVSVIAHERNAGLAATLNEGLERARHELVLRMDQDDVSLPSRIRVQCEYMDAHPAVAVAGAWVFHMGSRPEFDRLVELPTTPRAIAARLLRENCLYHPSVIMRRSVVLGAGGYRSEFRNAEDYDLWLRLSRQHDLANIDEPLLRYRFSIGGMTLGRKWEQLYYVHLAQAVHREPSLSLENAGTQARETLAEISQQWFMTQVANGTVSELVKLRQWRDALEVSARFANEIGLVGAAKLAGLVARKYLSPRRTA